MGSAAVTVAAQWRRKYGTINFSPWA